MLTFSGRSKTSDVTKGLIDGVNARETKTRSEILLAVPYSGRSVSRAYFALSIDMSSDRFSFPGAIST
jgi:hypothetical protein